ncbi:MAG: glycosyl hydrolase family 31 [Clostridia bacterium]|nr:glycosyl hydrolase family 31 [Clostridia bacterium]NCC42322.1 glycosyl hydrolase family 31 [Clostridia bacterium]
MVVDVLAQEVWYGGNTWGSSDGPIKYKEGRKIDLRGNQTPNQSVPLLVSNKGRYLWGENGFCLTFKNDQIETDREITIGTGYENLKGAYLAAKDKHFPFQQIHLSRKFVETPVYNTWIELTFDQNEKDVLTYAGDILANDLPAGILMIDDGWSDYYGKWTFNAESFPSPKKMLDKLHEMGFSVMLWICPFITPDTKEYRETRDCGYLITTKEGKPLITEWWNGYSAALDLSNPDACEWLKNQLGHLQEIGVDGFKFDAGDSIYYPKDMVTKGNVSPDEMSYLWCKFGENYEYNEFRAAWRAGGMSLMQRLCDKPHDWSKEGFSALIPDTLTQGILGMPFSSPDMIGGGEYLNFWANIDNLDEELFVRYAQISSMMPVTQFSAAPWRVLKKENFEKVLECMKIRQHHQSYFVQCWENAVQTGEPIIRYMEYAYPHCGAEEIIDQFMVGDKLLVAPVCEKGKESRSVWLPEGIWETEDGSRIVGGESMEIKEGSEGGILLWRI